MKLTYAYPRKCPTTLLRFVLGTLLMKLAPGVVITREQESILKLIPEYKLISFEKRSQLKLNGLYVIIGGL